MLHNFNIENSVHRPIMVWIGIDMVRGKNTKQLGSRGKEFYLKLLQILELF